MCKFFYIIKWKLFSQQIIKREICKKVDWVLICIDLMPMSYMPSAFSNKSCQEK